MMAACASHALQPSVGSTASRLPRADPVHVVAVSLVVGVRNHAQHEGDLPGKRDLEEIGLGSPEDADASLLQDIAALGEGNIMFTRDPRELPRLFSEIGPRFAARPGGYTRILKLGHREGDGADIARIELLAE